MFRNITSTFLKVGKVQQFGIATASSIGDSGFVSMEKSLNQVTLLGRVGVDPQLRGTDRNPVVQFTLATNTNYRSGDDVLKQQTEWHRISIFKPFLRDSVSSFLRKGSRCLVMGKIKYGEVVDAKGITHQTTTVIADDVIFIGATKQSVEAIEEEEQAI